MIKFNIDKIILISLILLLNGTVVYCVDTNGGSLRESQPVPTKSSIGNTIRNRYNDNVISARFYLDYYGPDKFSKREIAYYVMMADGIKLKHPNKIDKIKFSNYTIEFDDDAKLPIGDIIIIYIYICKHYNPVLIQFCVYIKGSLCHYFYSLNNDKNKWSNHKIKYDNIFKEYTDKNGTIYYKYSGHQDSYIIDEYQSEDETLARIHCNEEKCAKVDTIERNNLEIYLK
ncbi:BMN2 family [Babesia microti strain RI]|uniref:BMN2 family n=1 Tax=Babesia microti (strain RI) TaxID=1133968 RepID=A0A0K3APH2_BABMR|nr:BMN2 family [Babesia microti strain RI]CTQ41564.1 BMN2 family [Babesia microti strain RI]|eukprot:XP_012649575.1 BMN2 family [Babesia microti strain RI]